jgi:hypothetical protein
MTPPPAPPHSHSHSHPHPRTDTAVGGARPSRPATTARSPAMTLMAGPILSGLGQRLGIGAVLAAGLWAALALIGE